ncbi:MAG TPA: hypothetical protein VES79_07800 [Solirubrobacteraceae bacterium]|nr:hypothetical protein [Solirubrobacteraceae bacterium]
MGGTVLYEVAGAMATLTLNRPGCLNAITDELIEDLAAQLDRAEAAVAVRDASFGDHGLERR